LIIHGQSLRWFSPSRSYVTVKGIQSDTTPKTPTIVTTKTMPKISLCDRCSFFAHTSLLVCAIHPYGPESAYCRDFDSAELWHPEDVQQFDPEMQTEWDWHPLFTGCCPDCGSKFSRLKVPPLHWRCRVCGWEDELF
jgi:hypothetical protein